jgi:tetratricopeptide (TPR) repeat protein
VEGETVERPPVAARFPGRIADLAPQWRAVDALLDVALDLPAHERARWVDALGGEHAGLRARMRELLALHAEIETGTFLDTLAGVDFCSATGVGDEPAAGWMVGPYRLVSELGRGGMGLVWLAERADGQLERKVAIKLPRLAWGSGFAQRLERERAILAALEHPHIARLYDAGVDARERPYFAMELVDGLPIDLYCGRHALGLRERIGLLLQVCDAVAHAHAHLVVHRDLKPSNILVTADAQVRLLDFGVAKLIEGEAAGHTALTQLEGRALTPDYASPEQLAGAALTTTSDVYSLGVVAYELLAGRRPSERQGQRVRGGGQECAPPIDGDDAPLASSVARDRALARQLRGELDAILNRALKADPAARYDSAAALAQDFERWLRHEPVLARPDSRAYRGRKFVRRHRVGVAASAALALSIAAGAALAAWQARIASAQAQRAEGEVERQEAVRNLYIEAMRTLSLAAANTPATLAEPHAVTRHLVARLREVQPRYAGRPGEWQALLSAVSVQLNYVNDFEGSLEVGREYLAHLKAHGGDAARIIVAHAALGSTLFHLQRLDESEAMRRAGVAWAPDAGDARTELARTALATELGGLLTRRGKRAEAMQVLAAAADVAGKRFAGDALHARVHVMLAGLHFGFDDRAALGYARRADQVQRADAAPDIDERIHALDTLGYALLDNGLAAEAQAPLREALRLAQRIYERGHRTPSRIVGRLAQALGEQGRHDDVRALLAEERDALLREDDAASRSAIERLRLMALRDEWQRGDIAAAASLVSAEPVGLDSPIWMRDSGHYLLFEVRTLALAGRGADALARMHKLLPQWPYRDMPATLWMRASIELAQAQLAAGQHVAARDTALRLRDLLDAHQGQTGWNRRVAVELAALAAARRGDAVTALREAEPVDDPTPPAAPSAVARAESALRRAEVLRAAGQDARAVALASAALADLHGQHPDSPRVAAAQRLGAAQPPTAGR